MVEVKKSKNEKEEKKKWFKVLSICLVVISWGLLIGLKENDSNYDGGILTIISIIITIAVLFFIYGKDIFKNKNKSEEEIPEEVSRERINKIIIEEVEKRHNNLIVEKPIEWSKSKTINKNVIYAFKINLELDDETFIIIINANYPDKIPQILESFDQDGKEISPHKINQAMNSMASNPLEEPDREISEEGVDSFGKPIRKIEKIIHKNKEEKKEELV